jgi:hypothetical protein
MNSVPITVLLMADLRWNVGLTFQKVCNFITRRYDLVGGSSTEPTITPNIIVRENESPNSLLDTNIGALILQMEIRSIIKQMVA